MTKFLLTSFLAGSIALAGAEVCAEEPPVGWFFLYPLTGEGEEALPGSGPTTLATLAGGFHRMYREGGVFDSEDLAKQLEFANRHGLDFGIISESNPLFTAPWMMKEIGEAGEAIRDFYGKDGTYASIRSPLFNRAQDDLIGKTVAHIQEHDTQGRLKWYHAGAEWWFPDATRYSPLDIAAFREWMRAEYGDIGAVNERWQSAYTSFEEIVAPLVEVAYMGPIWGKHRYSKILSRENGGQFCAWSTTGVSAPVPDPERDTCPQVVPGERYRFSAWVKASDVAGQGAQLQVGWIPKGSDAPKHMDATPGVTGTSEWTRVEARFEAPEDAERAWLLLTLTGTGTAAFHDLFFGPDDTGENLAPDPDFAWADPATSGWAFMNWSGGEFAVGQRRDDGGRNGGGGLEISVGRGPVPAQSYGNQEAAIYDWTRFWMDTAAEAVNTLSAKFKNLDPSRPTVSYLTNAWTLTAEWDETQRHAVSPDVVAARADAVDVFGLQLCSADGDPFRITSVLDLVRKYGKPMWNVDLIDFTSGVHIGLPTLNRMTQSAVQHGASGFVYCGWNIPFAQDYNYHPTFENAELKTMLDDARASIRAVEGMKIRPDCAILLPFMPASPGDIEFFKNDPASYMGWYKILESMHLTVDVVTLMELAHEGADLAAYPWVLVPDCAWLPAGALDKLAAYAAAGGRVVTGGRFALFDETGRAVPREKVETMPRTALPDHGGAYAGDRLRDTHAGNTPPLFLWRKQTPKTSRALDGALDDLRRVTGSTSVLSGPASQVRCVKYESDGTRAWFLVNLGTDPVAEGEVGLALGPGDAASLEVLADGKPVARSVDTADGGMSLPLPAFSVSCIVKVTSEIVDTSQDSITARNTPVKQTHDLATLDWKLTGWTPELWRLMQTMELSEIPSAEIRSVPAKVPGSVQYSLREAGLLPDWNVDENWRLCEWVEHRHWIYETDLPAEWLREGAQSRLVCLGLDYQGMVMLNGEIIGEFRGTHIPHAFDLTPHLADGRNTLRIIFDLPPRWLGQFGFTSKVTEWKTRFNYTWDWMPRLVQTGIWDGIYIEVGDGRGIGAVAIDTDVNLGDQTGILSLRGGVAGDGQGTVRVTLSDGSAVIRSEELSGADYAARGVDWTSLPVQLWWPNGEGDQPLYDLAIELLDDNGQKIDSITRRVGFRNITWASCEGAPEGADPWLCVVNGRPVFLQGVNFPPLLPNYADVTEEMHRKRIGTYRDLGLNIFRINGVGYLESETFYNLCDEAGIMVWQDVPLSSSGVDNYPPEDETTIREVCAILESFIERRRHHPSLIVWCGGNELQKVNADGLSVPVDETHPLIAAMARVAREKDPRRRFLATTATGPRFYAQPEDFGKGLHWDVHGPWKIAGTMDDWRQYWEKDDALFRSEAGCPGASPEALIRRYADRLDPMPVSVDNPMWRRPLTWWIEDDAFRNEKGREPETLAEYVEWSQARQLEALVIAIRACRSRFPQCGGIMLWCGHDCFPCATNTSILDFDGNPKPAAGAFKIAAEM